MLRFVSVAAVVLLVALHMAAAHEVAAPGLRRAESRLLHDCVDDHYGGDNPSDPPPGHELHTLDVREVWDSSLQDAVVFRIILDGEDSGRVELQFRAGGQMRTYSWQTNDGSTWTGQGFDRTVGPYQALDAGGNPDGSRFVLEGWVQRSKLGIGEGDKVTDYALTGFSGGQARDRVTAGQDGDQTGPLQPCDGKFGNPTAGYTLAGPGGYASLSVTPASGDVLLDTERFIEIRLANELQDRPQRLTLSYTGGDGLDVRFHDPATGQYAQSSTVTLAKRNAGGSSTLIHLAVSGQDAGATGTVVVRLTTEYGGLNEGTFDYTVESGKGPTGTTGPDGDDDNGSPGPAVLALIAALLAATLVARRRR